MKDKSVHHYFDVLDRKCLFRCLDVNVLYSIYSLYLDPVRLDLPGVVNILLLLPFVSFVMYQGLSGLLLACSGRLTSCFRHRPFLRWTATLSIWILLFPRRWFLLDYTNCASPCEFLRTNLASRPDEIVDKGIDWLCFVKREGFHWDKDTGWWRGGTGGAAFISAISPPSSFFFFFYPLSFPHLTKLFPEIFQYGLHCTLHGVVIQGELNLF